MTSSGEMSREQWEAARRLFDAAIELPADERCAWIESATDDARVHREVEAMLAGHDRVDDMFVEPPSLVRPDPDCVAGFRVIRELARGGMGCVYEAERKDFAGAVALKIIRPGLLSSQVIRRFRREAESLARLEHPAIAHVLEAGAARTADGEEPYIAMELVDGDRLDRYLAAVGPPLAARIAMLAEIADGVHHAHQRGVVHRDLKPGNILVDRDGRPRIVDFGVARLLGQEATASRATITGQLIGTLPYMSPEQIAGGPEVDARADVYALGVLGFEMLTGALPYDVRDKPVVEAVRIIDADEPTRLSAFDQAMRGDLDTIIRTAIAKEPDRRYPSASALANDLGRWLRGEAIEARPPGPVEQFGRFARRNRGLVAGFAVAAAALVAGTAISTSLAIRATRSTRVASRAEEAAAADAVTARRETARAARVQAFLQSVVAGTDPRSTGGSAHAAVARAAGRVDEEFVDDPAARVIVLGTISDALVGHGDLDAAMECAERTWESARNLDDLDPAERAETVRRLAERYRFGGRIEEAARVLDDGVAATDPAAPHGARLLVELGRLRTSVGHHEEGQRLLRRAADQLRPMASTAEVVAVLVSLVESHGFAGTHDEAIPVAHEAIELAGPADSPTRQSAMETLIYALRLRQAPGDLAEAEATAETVVAMTERMNDPTAMPRALSSLAAVCATRGDLDRAVDLYRDAIAGKESVYTPGHYEVAQTTDNLAGALENAGRYADAVPLRQSSLAINRLAFGPDHDRTRSSLLALADDLVALDRIGEARAVLVEALEEADAREDTGGALVDGVRERLAAIDASAALAPDG